MATATKIQTVLFYTKSSNLAVVRIPEIMEPTTTGGLRRVQEGLTYDFAPDGRLRVEPGQDRLPTGEQERDDNGGLLWDDNGYPVLAYEDAPTFLRRCPSFNVFFFEEGNEPYAQKPLVDEMLDWLVDATLDGDADRVEELLAQENGSDEQPGHRREIVIRACERSLEKIAERAQPRQPGSELLPDG